MLLLLGFSALLSAIDRLVVAFLRTREGNLDRERCVFLDALPRGDVPTPAGRHDAVCLNTTILDKEYASEHPGVRSGECVQIPVSDTGNGMDREVLSHMFEPFFTTKEPGKGTGLGLSTVYGIVKQSDGHITCSSELGKGTTFTIHFPRTDEARDRSAAPIGGVAALHGSETILPVEDDETLRRFTQTVLGNNGYKVIGASGGREALAAIESQKCDVALLVTDVVMPQMNGKELAQKLLLVCPKVKVLLYQGTRETR